jgi:hypothetical protein
MEETMSKSHSQNYLSMGVRDREPGDQIDLSNLPEALRRAIRESWYIAPVAARSKHASLNSSCIAGPAKSAEKIAQWADEHPDANYCVVTGRDSNLVVLEVNHEIGQDSLCALCSDEWGSWLDTLQFADELSTFFLFRHEGHRARHLSKEFNGLRIYFGSRLLLPPSKFVVGGTLSYSNPDANVLLCPGFLLDSAERESQMGKIIPFPKTQRLRIE